MSVSNRKYQRNRIKSLAAYNLRRDGLTIRQIAERLGITEKQAAERVKIGERFSQ